MVVGSAMEQRYDCNVVLVGDCKVGKTALANRFVSTKFSEVRLRTNRPLLSVMGTLVGRPSSHQKQEGVQLVKNAYFGNLFWEMKTDSSLHNSGQSNSGFRQ